MGASIREQSVGGLRWLVVSGPRIDAFRALGEHARREIHDAVLGMPERPALERLAATETGRAAVERVVAASRTAQPVECAELAALAAGAGLGLDTMFLANVRGDLGGDDGTGCSDLGWRRGRSAMAHNEDGAPALQGRFMLVTLALDGEAPVTAQWYAGFLPSNTFVVNGHGLAWGINHLQVGAPAAAPGRHFVARGLQQAESLEAAVDYLGSHPSAGGYAYNFGEVATGRVATVEAAAGRVAVVEADPAERPLLWHTNHLRFLDEERAADAGGGVVDEAARSLGHSDESKARGRMLEAVDPPSVEPSADWFLDIFTTPAPHGVYRSAAGADPLMTLCSAAVDLTSAEVTLQARGEARVHLPLADFAAGRTSALSVPR